MQDISAAKKSIQSDAYDALILGAGVSGLVAAQQLAERGLRICLLDIYEQPGGNHLSRDFGPYTFDVGAIFFWSDNPLFSRFPGLDAECVPLQWDVDRVTPEGSIHKYPFDIQKELWSKPTSYKTQVAYELAMQRITPKKKNSADDFARYYLGATLFRDSGLRSYFGRFYGLPADEISYEFATSRMDWIPKNAGLRCQLAKLLRRDRLSPPNATAPHCLARPRAGFPAMYEVAVRDLRKLGATVVTGTQLTSAYRLDAGFVVETPTITYKSARLISSIPLALTARLFRLPASEIPESSSLTTLCCRFRGHRRFRAPILYNFSNAGSWKRLTVHSDYYGKVDDWGFFGVEVTQRGPRRNSEPLFEEFLANNLEFGLFNGEVELVGSFVTDYAYPIFDQQASAKRNSMLALLSSYQIEMLGRQGLFDYIPSASLAVTKVDIALASPNHTNRW